MKRLFSLVLAIGVGSGICAAQAKAFTLIGSSLLQGWEDNELRIHYNPENCPIPEAALVGYIEDAIKVWNSASNSRLKMVLGDRVATSVADLRACTRTAEKPVPAIVCDPALSTTIGTDARFIPAATAGTECVSSGLTLTYGYILLNAQAGKAAKIDNLSAELMRVVVAHELGHVLGLGHTQNSSSLMYFDATEKAKLALSADDRDGVAYLYPRRELGEAGLFGCGTVSDRGASGGLRGIHSFFGLLLFCALAVRVAKGRSHDTKPLLY